jgi:hypothetical protein
MAELAKITDDRFAALLESVAPPRAPSVSLRRERLREHVALLSAFDAVALPSPDADAEAAAAVAEFLTADCERVATRQGQRWSLRHDVRVETLAELDRRGRLMFFEGPTDQADIVCRMALEYIDGSAPALKGQTLAELRGTAQASTWLSGTSVAIPSAARARAQQTIEAMLEPLRPLVAEGFFGRSVELDLLSDYAEVLPPGRRSAGVVRQVRRLPNIADAPPLLIHGPGGSGKSTLVARFVLEHVDGDVGYRFPFAYLTFDRAELRTEQPLTLLAEAAIQLGALFPDAADEAAALAQSARSVVASAVVRTRDRRATKGSWSSTAERESGDEAILIRRFGQLIERTVGTREVPNVWVLDTFEVAQRQAPTAVDRLWRFLDRLQAACPRLRVVLCGRIPLDGHTTIALHLGALDDASALQMLQTQLADLRLPDEFLRRVMKAVSTQPISLRLAVLLIRQEAATGLSTESRRNLLVRLGVHEVQGVLYRRIIDHIPDERLRRIVHPGLALRRVTADVIREVLAGPCELGSLDTAGAQALFEALEREVALVETVGPGVVRQRPDIRRVMLPLMTRDDTDRLATVREAALRYFSAQDTAQAKAEELYYRLALGQATATLDGAFDPLAARALADEIEEFPASSRVYLANRLGLTVAPDLLEEADDLSWARQATLSARRLLDGGAPERALDVVRSRRSETVRPFIGALEVEALAALHRFAEALTAATSFLEWCADHDETAAFVDIALLAARIAEDTGDFPQALRLLTEVDAVAGSARDRVGRLTASVAMLRIHRRGGTDRTDDALALRNEVIRMAEMLTSRERSRNPGLVRDLAAEVGTEAPDLVRDALRSSGFQADSAPLPSPEPRDPDEAPPLTSIERGDELSEVVIEREEVPEEVTRTLQTETDESAF